MTDPAKAIVCRLKHSCRGLAETRLRNTRSSEWRSLLFDGAQHRMTIELIGGRPEEAAASIRAAAATPFDIPGHLIADISVRIIDAEDETPTVVVEALTVQLIA